MVCVSLPPVYSKMMVGVHHRYCINERACNVLLSFSNCSITPSGRGGGGGGMSSIIEILATSVNDVIVLFLVTPLMTLVNTLVT